MRKYIIQNEQRKTHRLLTDFIFFHFQQVAIRFVSYQRYFLRIANIPTVFPPENVS